MPFDPHYREPVRLNNIRAGENVTIGEGIQCMKLDPLRVVYHEPYNEELFVRCDKGRHYLRGHVTSPEDDTLVNIYR